MGDFYYFVVSFIIYIGSFYIPMMLFDINKVYTMYIPGVAEKPDGFQNEITH